jgi:hypothetical protein
VGFAVREHVLSHGEDVCLEIVQVEKREQQKNNSTRRLDDSGAMFGGIIHNGFSSF